LTGHTLHVLHPGLCTLVVDFGRRSWRSLGVPLGGAADRRSLALGNALVGNPPDAAALEVTLAGPTLMATCDLACVLFGAPFAMTSDRQPLRAGKTFTLALGEELRVGGTPEGVRGYFCVRGGLAVPTILGSRSGIEPLAAGAELPCEPSAIRPRFLSEHPAWDDEPTTLRVLPGPQASWFREEEFYPQAYTVSPASNRMGLRLRGTPLTLPDRELVSEPVCPGTVQVTRDGQCIVLGVDGQTIGGYPKVAQVIGADLDKVGQLRPGTAVRFRRVDLDEAERLSRQQRARLHEWLTRVRTAEVFVP
jgi:antagonist of KipI